VSARLAVIASAAVAAALWFGLMQHDSSYRDGAIIDTPVYLAYADHVAHGKLPYRDFAVEYPPLAFVAFLPPRAVAADPSGYRDRFGDLMGLMLVVAAAATAAAAAASGLGTSRTLAAGLLVAAGPALAGSVSLTRFDLWPVLLVALALAAIARRADRLAGVLLGLGVAAKLWPALLLPVALTLAWRRGGPRRALEAGAAALAACALPFAVALALSPSGLWHALSVQASRPLQIESLGAATVLALSHLGLGGPYHVVTSSGSQNLAGSLAPLAARLSSGLVLVVLAWTLWRGVESVRRAGDDAAARSQTVRYGLAAVVASIALGHVLSPQFVLWLLPFPLLIRGWRGWAAGTVTVGILALTQVEFPGMYWDYALRQDGSATAVVLAHDLALLALLAVLVSGRGTRRRSSAAC
jgi:hypothetical protein